jgi:hypothetical protein
MKSNFEFDKKRLEEAEEWGDVRKILISKPLNCEERKRERLERVPILLT